jgi:hypothetical protein
MADGNALHTERAQAERSAEFRDALLSGRVGRPLLTELHARFRSLSRWDCFLGLSESLAIWSAHMVATDAENARLDAENGALRIENHTLRRELAALRPRAAHG